MTLVLHGIRGNISDADQTTEKRRDRRPRPARHPYVPARPATTRRRPDATETPRATSPGLLGRFKDLPTARKLMIGFLLMVALMAVVGGLGIVRLASAQDRVEVMFRDNFEATLWLADTTDAMSTSTDALHDAVISGERASIPTCARPSPRPTRRWTSPGGSTPRRT